MSSSTSRDQNNSTCLYTRLGVTPNATPEEIRKAYRRGALREHPDRNPGNGREAEERFKKLNQAYEILSDDNKRRMYDASGRAEVPEEQFTFNGEMSDILNKFMHDVFANMDRRTVGLRRGGGNGGGLGEMLGALAVGGLAGLGGIALAAVQGGDSRLMFAYGAMGTLLGAGATVVVDSVAEAMGKLEEGQKVLMFNILGELVNGFVEERR